MGDLDLQPIRGFLRAHATLGGSIHIETRDRIAAIAVAGGEYVLRASDLAAMVTEVERLRTVADAARELLRLLDAGIGDYDIPGEAMEAALDALGSDSDE